MKYLRKSRAQKVSLGQLSSVLLASGPANAAIDVRKFLKGIQLPKNVSITLHRSLSGIGGSHTACCRRRIVIHVEYGGSARGACGVDCEPLVHALSIRIRGLVRKAMDARKMACTVLWKWCLQGSTRACSPATISLMQMGHVELATVTPAASCSPTVTRRMSLIEV